MKQALKEAQLAYEEDEVPIGAIIRWGNTVIAKGRNQIEKLQDVTAHAEVLAITSASNYLNNKYLHDCILYVTLEPCVMCAGALYWSQIGGVVYGASDAKKGFMHYGKELLHPQTKLSYGVCHEECSALMKKFFKNKR